MQIKSLSNDPVANALFHIAEALGDVAFAISQAGKTISCAIENQAKSTAQAGEEIAQALLVEDEDEEEDDEEDN